MKVIELLNKIANGEEYKKFRIRYFDIQNDYEDKCVCTEYAIGFRLYNHNIELNDEIKIIEEPQEHKIPEKIDEEAFEKASSSYRERLNKDKINEILDYLEEIEKGE